MSIRIKLFLTFFALTVFPLGIIGFTNRQNVQNVGKLMVAESTDLMKQLGEKSIQQKAEDTAQQVALGIKFYDTYY